MNGQPHSHGLTVKVRQDYWYQRGVRIQYGDQSCRVMVHWPRLAERIEKAGKKLIARHDWHSRRAGMLEDTVSTMAAAFNESLTEMGTKEEVRATVDPTTGTYYHKMCTIDAVVGKKVWGSEELAK